MIPQIAFFNHKGGVSKTTSLFNIGWKLSELGKKVLLVDCDPQCNLTGLVLNYSHNDTYPYESKEENQVLNITEGLAPAFEGRPIPLKPVIAQSVVDAENLFILPGHVALSENESSLSIAHELSNSLTVMQNIPGAMRHLFQITAEEINADVILVDMSPSLGALNQNLLMTSEYFIIPMAPDFFSAMALRSLSRVIPKWMKWSLAASEQEILREAAYPWPSLRPKYLGSIVQNYRKRARGDGEPKPTRAYQKWFDELSTVKKEVLLPTLKSNNMLLSDDIYEKANSKQDEFLMEVPDFNSLIAIAQNTQKPVFALCEDDIEATGVVKHIQITNRDHFNQIYEEGAKKIISILESYDN